MVDSVMEFMFYKTVPCYDEIISNKEISSLEKIRQILINAVTAKEQVDVYFPLSKSLVYNPKLSAAYLDFTKDNLVAIFCELIKEGMEDGTIRIKEPEIMAELLAVILNIWLSPIIFMDSKEKFIAKLSYASDILDNVGLPIIDQEVNAAFEKITSTLPDREKEESSE